MHDDLALWFECTSSGWGTLLFVLSADVINVLAQRRGLCNDPNLEPPSPNRRLPHLRVLNVRAKLMWERRHGEIYVLFIYFYYSNFSYKIINIY